MMRMVAGRRDGDDRSPSAPLDDSLC